jgi:hypothetical protein
VAARRLSHQPLGWNRQSYFKEDRKLGIEMTTPDNIQIKPGYIRSVWYYSKIIFTTLLVVKIFELIIEPTQSLEYWALKAIITFIIFILAALLLIHSEQENNLFITSTYGVTGPSGVLNHERTFINFENIDVNKSRKQNILERLLGYRYIFTNTTDKIFLNQNFFTREQIVTILTKTSICQ